MTKEDYKLDAQIGFLLRKANQRHLSIFGENVHELTPTQFATLAKLYELGPTSQNLLGRETAMDAATIKGVVDRLTSRGLVFVRSDRRDRRRVVIELSQEGRTQWEKLVATGLSITRQTLAPLKSEERQQLLALLSRLT